MSSHRAFPPAARCRIDNSFSVVDDGVLLYNEALPLPLPIHPIITQVTWTAPPNNNGHFVDGGLILDARVARRMISLSEANRRRIPSSNNGASEKAISDFLMTSSTLCEKSAAAADDGGADPDVCSVCLDLYRENQRIGVLGCRHRFHAKCIAEWLQINNICPLCKAVGI